MQPKPNASHTSGTLPSAGEQPSRVPSFANPIPLIHRKMHGRISEPVTAPCRVRHSAYLLPGSLRDAEADVRRHFEEVARSLDIPAGDIRWGDRSGRCVKELGSGHSLRIVWELHTEFYSYTTYHVAKPDSGNRDEPVAQFTFPLLSGPGIKLVDLDILVAPGLELGESLSTFLQSGHIYGGQVLQEQARVWTTFQVDENGQGRYVVAGGELPPGRLGRLIRRLVEIENYYHLILLPLEEYQEQVISLREIEQRITRHSEDIAADLASRETDPEREHRWLVHLTRDLAELIRLTERMRYKFSAANSYYAIFEERLRWLREQTGEQFQSIEEFLTNRVAPAIRNYQNFVERADALTTQMTSLGNMMRTRVNLNMEQQSLETMRAMDRRAELQLILQRTVEGLSLIVLSYYLTGLAGYALKAVDMYLPLPGGATLWTAASIPLWLSLAWGFTRRIKKLVKDLAAKKPER